MIVHVAQEKEQAVIMASIEKKRVEMPIIIFLGKDSRNFSSA